MARSPAGRSSRSRRSTAPRWSNWIVAVLLAVAAVATVGVVRNHRSTPDRVTTGVSEVAADRSQRTNVLASTALATLAIKGRAPMTGYSRDRFGPAWTDDNDSPLGHNGCDTRNDILDRDLTDPTLFSGRCLVAGGLLVDPYSGRRISFERGAETSSAVQIDHVVALGDAWQTGAQQWDNLTRTRLANDPLNLLAVDGPTNQDKGDSDAASWLPPNTRYRCAYVARQIAVKARYRLWVTRAEHDALGRILTACPSQTIPGE